MKIWLADLTYTQQSIASDVVPAAIGMIAEYTEKRIPDLQKIKLFKYPEKLSDFFEKERPDLIGFSNYIWNSSLTDIFLKTIKKKFPKIITVVGGPNFPTSLDEQKEYLTSRPWIDFYIVKEGEHAFATLVENLMKKAKVDDLRNLPNLVFQTKEYFYSSDKIERIMDLSEIPSPYLSKRLDEFLDGKLLPITQTNRGCPFTCTFCTEGQRYWTKVRRKPRDIIEGELSYISKKMNDLEKSKRRTDLLIADSNFGMFEEDLDTCRVISKEQDKTGYPKYINVATGKNKKERVLEAAKIVKGAMKLAGSVQSLDNEVQDNIKRKNISSKEIVEMALKSSEIGANTYSEVILGLPGDTKEKHFSTLRVLIESSFTTISMYQLMILPGTELGSKDTKFKHKMKTKYRVVPRCYGSYNFLGEELNVAEIEEICVANETLSFEDYLECRKMNLIINIFYNDGVFEEILSLIRNLKKPIFDWLLCIYKNSKLDKFKKFDNFMNDFLNDSEKELWDDYDSLKKFTSNKDSINNFIQGKLGSNLIFKYKSRSLTTDFTEVSKIALFSSREFFSELVAKNKDFGKFIEDVIQYKSCQVSGIFELEKNKSAFFDYNIKQYFQDNKRDNFNLNIGLYKTNNKKELSFKLSDEQYDQINSYNKLFGKSLEGISRTLSRVYIKKFFRKYDEELQINDEFNTNNSRRWGGGLDSI